MRAMLTEKAIEKFKVKAIPYEVADLKVPGLSLRVLSSGVRTWSLRYKVDGRPHRIALGLYADLSLADARELATEHRRSIRKDGANPARERRERREAMPDTFAALAERYIELHAKPKKRTWKGDVYMIAKLVPKRWQALPPNEITRADVRELIEAKAASGAPIQANRLRALLHKLFAFAVARDVVPFNPVTGVERPGVEKARDRVLTEDEIRTFWTMTEQLALPMRAFWRLRLVTAQRQTEIADMKWTEIDFADKTWTIPAERAKNGLSHRVPLSDLALEILGELPRFDEYVLAGARGNRQRYAAAAVVSIPDFKGHDLRRTAASYMASAGVPRHHIGRVLNHVETGVTAVYDRHSYDPEKRVALDTWARRLRAILEPAEVAPALPFRRARRVARAK